MIGDREADVEAAKGKNILSIGVIYGHGPREIINADIKIDNFSKLKHIFDKKNTNLSKDTGRCSSQEDPGKTFILGINGIDNSGKTEFARDLELYLKKSGYKTQLIKFIMIFIIRQKSDIQAKMK